eukprot:scaffold32599_cov154-Skeletonema_menzelii.AAC.1
MLGFVTADTIGKVLCGVMSLALRARHDTIDIFGRSTGDHNAIRMEQMMSYKERDKKIARTEPYRLLAMRQAMILFFNLECNYWGEAESTCKHFKK